MLKKTLLILFMVFTLSQTLFSISAKADNFAYVVNNLGQTLSKINLTTDEVVNDIVILGDTPNQIVIQGDFAYVVNSIDNDIQIIDLKSQATVGYIIGQLQNPFHMAFVDSQHAYVTNLMANTISKIDVIDKAVVGEFALGQAPEGLLVVGNKLYVCCTGFEWRRYKHTTGRDWIFDPTHRANEKKAYSYIPGKVYVFDIQSEQVTDSISVGLNPQYLARDPGGELNVVCTGDYWSVFGQIYRINPTTNTVIDSIATGGSPGIVSIGFDGIGYLAAGGWHPDPGLVYTFDSDADTMLRDASNPVTTHNGVIAVSSLSDFKVLTCNFDADDVTMVDSSGTILKTYLVGDGPISMALYPPVSHQVPFLDSIGVIIMVALLITFGSLKLFRKRNSNVGGRVS